MTLLSATCCIVDELVDSGSFLRTQVSACDYGIMDSGPASAVTVRPGLTSLNYIGYGNVSEIGWGITVQGWVLDTGKPTETLANVIHIHDALRGAIMGGSIANCASLSTTVRSMSHNPDLVFVIGGHDYFLVTATVRAEEDP